MTAAERALASVPQTAHEYGVSKTALYSWIERGDVPAQCYVRLGGRLHVRRKAFAAFMAGAA